MRGFFDGWGPFGEERERTRTTHLELRRSRATRVASGTLACPHCDAPVLPAGAVGPADLLSCPYCLYGGAVREFLSLGEPTRPQRVAVRIRGLAPVSHGPR